MEHAHPATVRFLVVPCPACASRSCPGSARAREETLGCGYKPRRAVDEWGSATTHLAQPVRALTCTRGFAVYLDSWVVPGFSFFSMKPTWRYRLPCVRSWRRRGPSIWTKDESPCRHQLWTPAGRWKLGRCATEPWNLTPVHADHPRPHAPAAWRVDAPSSAASSPCNP